MGGTDEKKPSFYGNIRQASNFPKVISNLNNIEKAPDELKSFKLFNFWGHVLKGAQDPGLRISKV